MRISRSLFALLLLAGATPSLAAMNVTNYSWLQLAPSDVTPLVGGYQVSGTSSANGKIGDFRWGNLVWVPNSALTWNSSTSAQSQYWGAVRLDQSRLVTSVRVETWNSSTELQKQYFIDGSNDGSSWTNIGVKTYASLANQGINNQQTIDTTDGNYQYIRVRFEPGDYSATNQSTGGYGGPGLLTIEPIGDGTIQNGSKINWANVQNFSTTLATNILTANHSDNRTGSGRSFLHGSLGDANSYEGFNNSMVNGEYFQVNLNGSRLVDQVVLVAASNYSPVSYNVQISTDGGANYNPVTGVSSAIYYPAGDTAGNAGATGYTFNPVDGVTNVRVTNGVVNGGGYWLINEFEVLGTVPEPTSLGLIGLGALALLRRRPRAC